LYLGTKLTLARGIGVEGSYVEWREEVSRTISSTGTDGESGHRGHTRQAPSSRSQ
jgi:hypothetical protein